MGSCPSCLIKFSQETKDPADSQQLGNGGQHANKALTQVLLSSFEYVVINFPHRNTQEHLST